jgi:hypothetical protein
MNKFFFISLIYLISSGARAQIFSFAGRVSGNVAVSAILKVDLSHNTSMASFTSLSTYENGVIKENSNSLSIKSNVSWLVNVRAQSSFCSPLTQGASSTMPCSVVGIRASGSPTFISLNTTGVTLKTGSRGNHQVSGNIFSTDLFYNPGFNYPGGIYSLGLLYTVTNP